METYFKMIDKEESAYLRAVRALEHLAKNLEGLAPGIPRLLNEMQLSDEEQFFLLYGSALITKVAKRAVDRQKNCGK